MESLVVQRAKWPGVVLAAAAFAALLSIWPESHVGAQGPDASSLLISTERLHGLLGDPNVRIVDARHLRLFVRGHIPGAVSFPYTSLLDPEGDLEGQRLKDSDLSIKFSHAGIDKDTYVVFYDDSGGHQAARFLWLLHYFGHNRISVLDGGYPKWKGEGRPILQRTELVERRRFSTSLVPDLLATTDYVKERLGDRNTVILDVRPKQLYAQGHIPGAINLPWTNSLNAGHVQQAGGQHGDHGFVSSQANTWKTPEKLRAMFVVAGVTPDKEIIVYCQHGDLNQHTYITLKYLGYSRVRSYELAYAGWSSDPILPKTEPEPLPPEPVVQPHTKVELAPVAEAPAGDGLSTLGLAGVAVLGFLLVVFLAGLGWYTFLLRRRRAMV